MLVDIFRHVLPEGAMSDAVKLAVGFPVAFYIRNADSNDAKRKIEMFKVTPLISQKIYILDRAEAAHSYVEARNFELPATDPKIRQHLIFSSLGLRLRSHGPAQVVHTMRAHFENGQKCDGCKT